MAELRHVLGRTTAEMAVLAAEEADPAEHAIMAGLVEAQTRLQAMVPGEVGRVELEQEVAGQREALRGVLRQRAEAAQSEEAKRQAEVNETRQLVQQALAFATRLEKEGECGLPQCCLRWLRHD